MSYAVQVKNVSMHFNMNKDKIDNLKEYCIKLLKHQLFFEDCWDLMTAFLYLHDRPQEFRRHFFLSQ